MNTKELIRGLIPPLAIVALNKMRRPVDMPAPFVEFFGDYQSFEAAAKDCVGYSNNEIAIRAVERSAAFKAAVPTTEIDSRVQQLHSAFLMIPTKPQISVLDVGGGNGATAVTLRRLMPDTEFDWTVLETSAMVAASVDANKSVRFIEEWPARKFDVALMSGSLQYFADPYAMLRQAKQSASHIIISRLPVHESERDRIVKQDVPPHLYVGSFAMHCFAAAKILSALKEIGSIVATWDVPADSRTWQTYGMQSRGFLICLTY